MAQNGFQLTWTIEGETQLSRRLVIMADRVKDWTPAFKETAYTLKEIFSGPVFDTEGAAIEEHWSPLSKAYALRKEKKHPGKGILEATGTMRSGFMTLWRPDMAQVWNKVEYFKYHQSNLPRRSGLPRRVIMKLAETQRQQVVKIFHTYFQHIVETT
jgi:phage gpG-like protein